MEPANETYSSELFALRSFLLAMIGFFIFLGVVAAAFRFNPTASPPKPSPTPRPTLAATTLAPVTPVSHPPTHQPSPTSLVAAAPLIITYPITALNGIPLDQIIRIPPEVQTNIQAIYTQGQQLGRNPHAFAKVGDSTLDAAFFLSPFSGDQVQLGAFAFLQPTITHFAGSWERQGMAVRVGLHSWTAMDPAWADKRFCQPAETVIACEFRLHNPSVVLIRLGSNDVGVPDYFAANVAEIVTFAITQGVIPVLGTKADRAEGSDENNEILREIAAAYQIPLWDFDQAAATLPGRGLEADRVHLNGHYVTDYRQPTAFQFGHPLHNLTALLVLDTIREQIMKDEG